MSAKPIDPVAPIAHDIDFLKNEFSRFRAELTGMKDELSDSATEALDRIGAYLDGGNLSSRMASLEAELEHLSGRLKDTGKDAVTRIEKQIEQRPITSIAIAFGVGLLTSQLIRRS
jgi:ElaB/YqjD/DUF883 family membrane-anchored ribosome-binding protein